MVRKGMRLQDTIGAVQIDRQTAVKLGIFAGVTVVAGAQYYFGLGENATGLVGTALFLAGAAAHATTGHFGVNVIEFLGKWLGGKDPARRQQNRDLQRLIGEAIARILERASGGAPGGKAGANYLKHAAAAFRDNWMEFELTGIESAVGENSLPDYFTGDDAGIKRSPVLETSEWIELLEGVAGQATFKWSEQALKFSAEELKGNFAPELWEAAKDAWMTDDPAWPALTLRLLSLILGTARDAAEASKATAGEIAKLRQELEELRPQIEALKNAIGNSNAMARSTTISGHIQAQKEVVEEIRGYQIGIEEELAGLQRLLDQDLSLAIPLRKWNANEDPPGAVLRAEYAAVPFHHLRENEVRSVMEWARDPAPIGVRLYSGSGGFGKTRFALECCQRLAEGDCFRAGFLRGDASDETCRHLIAESARTQKPLFVVIDYVESVPENLTRLVRAARSTRQSTPVRMLLLTRGVGMWWQKLLHASDGVGDLLSGPATCIVEAKSLAVPPELRQDVFLQASIAFRDCLGLEKSNSEAIDLTAPHFNRFLMIHMCALLDVQGERVPEKNALLDRVIGREVGYLERMIASKFGQIYVDGVDQAVRIFTSLGGASSEEDAISILTAIPYFRSEDYKTLTGISNLLHVAYGGEKWIEPLQPDILQERVTAGVISRWPELFAELAGR
jgi:hypothetical protein